MGSRSNGEDIPISLHEPSQSDTQDVDTIFRYVTARAGIQQGQARATDFHVKGGTVFPKYYLYNNNIN